MNSPLDGGTLLAALVGAVVLLAVVNLFRRGAVR
ncbi:MAG: GlsB/YeaQ/YmgE family stress response membrane protein [Pseudomonadota bacterium]|nr:GlsB/YeaQ/YmgE family stress response membrane protein [Pseudomonadota bacterium]